MSSALDKCYICGKEVNNWIRDGKSVFCFCKTHRTQFNKYLKEQGWEKGNKNDKESSEFKHTVNPFIAEIEKFRDLYSSGYSTILLKRRTIDLLKKKGNKGETYDDIVLKGL